MQDDQVVLLTQPGKRFRAELQPELSTDLFRGQAGSDT